MYVIKVIIIFLLSFFHSQMECLFLHQIWIKLFCQTSFIPDFFFNLTEIEWDQILICYHFSCSFMTLWIPTNLNYTFLRAYVNSHKYDIFIMYIFSDILIKIVYLTKKCFYIPYKYNCIVQVFWLSHTNFIIIYKIQKK